MITLRPAIALCCLAFPALALAHAHQEHEHEHHGHAHNADHAREEGFTQTGAHQHGVGALNLVLDGDTLEIELSGPAVNFLGFEHEPLNDAQRQQAQRALATLRQPGALFILPAKARCVSDSVEIDSALLANVTARSAAEKEHHHEHTRGQGKGPDAHQDIAAHYRFRCENPAALDSVELAVFTAFPNTERLRVQSIGASGQSADEATASQPVMKL